MRAFDSSPGGRHDQAIPVGDGTISDGDGTAPDGDGAVAGGDTRTDSDTSIAPTLITYNRTWRVYLRGHASPPIAPEVRGGAPTSYSVAPPLPAGLVLDAKTGTISGAPTVAVGFAAHVITGANPEGSATTSLEIEVGDGFLVDTKGLLSDASPGDGVCADTAGSCSLRAAVEESNSLAGRQVVAVPAGTYQLATELSVTDDLALVGAGRSTTILDGGNAVRVLHLTNLTLFHLSDVTLDHGKGTHGASLLSNGITPDLSLHVTNCVFQNGAAAGDTGGLWNSRNGKTTIEHSMFQGCTAGAHGGALALGFTTTGLIRHCVFRNNSAGGDGGAVYFNYDTELEDSTIASNSATGTTSRGGGLFVHGKVQLLQNNTFTDNTAAVGGAIFVDPDLDKSLVERDGVVEQLAGPAGIAGKGSIQLFNTIVLGNKGDDCGAPVSTHAASFEGGTSCGLTGAGSKQGVSATQVKLSALQDNGGPVATMLPAPDSIAVDAADNAQCPKQDARGDPRPVDRGDGAGGAPDGVAACDVGAVELQ